MSVDTFQENLERFIVTTCSGVTFIELNYLEGRKWEVLGGGGSLRATTAKGKSYSYKCEYVPN